MYLLGISETGYKPKLPPVRGIPGHQNPFPSRDPFPCGTALGFSALLPAARLPCPRPGSAGAHGGRRRHFVLGEEKQQSGLQPAVPASPCGPRAAQLQAGAAAAYLCPRCRPAGGHRRAASPRCLRGDTGRAQPTGRGGHRGYFRAEGVLPAPTCPRAAGRREVVEEPRPARGLLPCKAPPGLGTASRGGLSRAPKPPPGAPRCPPGSPLTPQPPPGAPPPLTPRGPAGLGQVPEQVHPPPPPPPLPPPQPRPCQSPPGGGASAAG